MGVGTVSLTVDFKQKPDRGREEVMMAGKVRMKGSCQIQAMDLELRTIKAFTAMPFAIFDSQGGPSVLVGSVNTPGSLNNSVTLKTYRGTMRSLGAAAAYGGTPHVGTKYPAGTTQASYFAIGA